MEHYFIANEALQTNERELSFSFRGNEFLFKTNNGLFSYKEVDYASHLLMEQVPPLTGSLLDMGCGYGVIGITLAKTYGLELCMCDVNEAALRYAKLNCPLNGVEAEFVHSDSFDGITGSFDSILLNPPIHAGKEKVFRMYEQAPKHLNPGGAFYIVIQKKHGAESHAFFLKGVFNSLSVIYKKKGYYVFICTC
jgi:16S rRNA (guanine1207-N2)-methyltransferase